MKEQKKRTEQNESEDNFYNRYILYSIIILLLTIFIPLFLIILNQTNNCAEHIEEAGGIFWILGRTLGFSTLSYFIFSVIVGTKTKNLAKTFKSYPLAKSYHCFIAFTTIGLFLLHVGFLLVSDPWGPMIFEGEYNHMPYNLFLIKIWTGIVFGIVMVSASFLFRYLKDMEKLKKFGYKNLIKVHHIMLVFSVILAVHIFLINIEIIILLWG